MSDYMLYFDGVRFAMDNSGLGKCGTTNFSNGCHVMLNYCTNCHHDA